MATLREDFLPVVDDARAIVDGYGLRTHGLTIRTRTWLSGTPGDGSYADSDLVITPRPKIREATMREVAASGGLMDVGDFIVTKITPAYAGGGYTRDQLQPTVRGAAVEHIYIVTDGPAACECTLSDLTLTKNFGYEMKLKRTTRTP